MKVLFRVLIMLSIASATVLGQIAERPKSLPWTWVTPLVTKRGEIEKTFGESITKDKTNPYQTYVADFGKINILFSTEKKCYEEYNQTIDKGIVINYFISPRVRLNVSELPYDLSRFKRDAVFSPREIWYVNEATTTIIVTEIVEGDGGIKIERLRALEYRAPSARLSKCGKGQSKLGS